MLNRSERINLVLRAMLEAAIVIALALWGYQAGGGAPASIGLMLAAPIVGFGFWGAVDFHQAGRLAEPLRLGQELIISGVAAVASYAAGSRALAIALAALSLVYHASVYATGSRLLTRSRRQSDNLAGRG